MDSVVKMKSLPFDACQLDVITFFDSFKLKPNGVQLVVRSDGKPTGEAFVDFEGPEEAARALRERDHKVFAEKFGDRYVRLIQVGALSAGAGSVGRRRRGAQGAARRQGRVVWPRAARAWALMQRSRRAAPNMPPPACLRSGATQVSRKEMQSTLALRFGGEGIIKVKGIPFKATAGDVRKFFSGHKVKQDGVAFIMHQVRLAAARRSRSRAPAACWPLAQLLARYSSGLSSV